MNNLYVITVAYCRSAQLANCLLNFNSTTPDKHIIVQGHYPIDKERNNEEIKLIADSYFIRIGESGTDVHFWDPGENLGSAQSQNWALKKLDLKDDDYWANLDPDTACHSESWATAMRMVLDADSNCAFVSCMSPMVKSFLREPLQEKIVDGINIGIPTRPTPFNLTMWRGKFMREIGEFTQLGPWWGELEAVMHQHCERLGYYHAYLLDHNEDESGKFFHPKSNAEWKDLHMRTVGPEQFVGNYEEFLRYKYPLLTNLRI